MVFIYCPVLHVALRPPDVVSLRPPDVVSSRLAKSCTSFSVGSSADGEQPRDLLDACEALELSSAFGN